MYFILLKRLIGSTFFLYLRVFDRSLVFASVTSPHAFAHLRWMCPRGGLHFRKNEVEVLGGGGRRKGNCKKVREVLLNFSGDGGVESGGRRARGSLEWRGKEEMGKDMASSSSFPPPTSFLSLHSSSSSIPTFVRARRLFALYFFLLSASPHFVLPQRRSHSRPLPPPPRSPPPRYPPSPLPVEEGGGRRDKTLAVEVSCLSERKAS